MNIRFQSRAGGREGSEALGLQVALWGSMLLCQHGDPLDDPSRKEVLKWQHAPSQDLVNAPIPTLSGDRGRFPGSVACQNAWPGGAAASGGRPQ